MPPVSWEKLLDGRHWMDPQPGPLSLYHFVLAGALALILVGLIYYHFLVARRRFGEHPFKMRLTRRATVYGAGISLVGLALLGARFGGVPFLSLPAFLYLTVLAGLALAGYLGYYLRRHYPSRLAEYDRRQLLFKYYPAPKGRARKKASAGKGKDARGKRARGTRISKA